MATAGSIVVDLLMRTGAFETDTKRAEDIAKKRAAAIDKAFEEMGQRIGLAAVAAGGAITAMVVSTANAAKEISNIAQVSGAGTEEFQRFAAGAKTVGIEQDKLGDIFKDFLEKVGEFVQTGGGGMKDFFEQIAPKVGITADAFRNLSGPQALQLYVDSLEKAGLSQEQMSFYLESMASDTTALIPLLRDGGKEMTALGNAAAQTGQIMSDQTLAAAKQLSLQMAEFSGIAAGVRNEIVGALLPALVEVANQMKAVSGQGSAVATIGSGIATVFETVTALGLNVSYVLKQIGNEIGGIGAQAAAVMRGDFAQAAEIGRMMKADAAAARAQVDKDTAAIISARNKIIGTGSGVRGAGFTDPRLLGNVPTVGGWAPPGKTTTAKTPRTSSSRTSTSKEDAPFVGPMPNVDLMERYLELEKEAVSLRRSLMSDNEVRAEQEAKYFELLGEGLITQEEFNKAMAQPVEEGYWEKWLESAEEAMTSFDDLAGNVMKNFSTQFGSAFEEMIFESQNLGDAISNLADGMLRSVVNAVGQMAAQWVAMELVKRVASQTTTSTVVAGAAAQTAAGVAANAAAVTSAAAAGPAIASSMAPAAVTASVATAGANTFPAIAGIMAAMALIPMLAGARANGGPVAGGKTYLVGERGPELFTPNTAGAIIPNHALGGGSGGRMTVNLIEDKSRAGQTQERSNNGAQELDVFVADIMGDGARSKALQRAFGLRRRGY